MAEPVLADPDFEPAADPDFTPAEQPDPDFEPAPVGMGDVRARDDQPPPEDPDAVAQRLARVAVESPTPAYQRRLDVPGPVQAIEPPTTLEFTPGGALPGPLSDVLPFTRLSAPEVAPGLSGPWGRERAEYLARQQAEDQQIARVLGEAQAKAMAGNKRAAEVRVATDFQLDPEVVKADFDGLLASWAAAKADPRKFAEQYPMRRRMLLERPGEAELIITDKPLNKLEQALNWAKDAFVESSIRTHLGQDESGALSEALGAGVAPKRQEAVETAVAAEKQEQAQRDQPRPTAELATKEALAASSWEIVQGRYTEQQRQQTIGKLEWELFRTTYGLTRDGGADAALDLEEQIARQRAYSTPLAYRETEAMRVLTSGISAVTSLGEQLEGGGLGAALGYLGGAGGAALVGQPELAHATGLTGARLVGKAGMFYSTLRLEGGHMHGELRTLVTEGGNRLTREEIAGGTVGYGVLAAVVEQLSTEQMLKTLGPLGEAFKKGAARAAFKELMADTGFRATMARIGKRWLASAAAEGGEEVVQDSMGEVTSWVLASLRDWQPQARQVVDWKSKTSSFAGGFVGGGLVGGAGSGVNLATHLHARAEAEKAAEVVVALQGLKDSPFTQAAPGYVAQQVAQQSAVVGGVEAEPVTHVYIDAPAVVRLFQKDSSEGEVGPTRADMEAHQAAQAAVKELMGEEGPALLDAALQAGTKLAVPLEDYLTKWGTKPIGEALVDDTTTQEWLYTRRELDSPALEAEAKKLVEAFGGEEEEAAEAQEKFAQLQEQLEAHFSKKDARYGMQLWKSVTGTLARLTGKSVGELFKGIDVEAVTPAEVRTRQHSELLLERAARLEPEERAAERFTDANTGLPNELGFLATPSEAPLVAVLSFEGAKAINDNPRGGHEAANRVYREVASALVGLNPTAAKVGGDFAVRVHSQEELDELLARLNKAVGKNAVGALGATLDEARDAHDVLSAAEVAEGRRSNPRPIDPEDPEGPPLAPERPRWMAEGQDLDELAKEAKLVEGKPHEALVASQAAMNPREYARQAYFEPSGILSALGWKVLPRLPAVAAFDLVGLRGVNDAWGDKAHGDEMLAKMAALAAELSEGGLRVEFAHLSGDEYAAQAETPEALEEFIERLEERLEGEPLEWKEPETGDLHYHAVQFRHGLGPDYESADRDLNRRKSEARTRDLLDRRARAQEVAQGAPEGGADSDAEGVGGEGGGRGARGPEGVGAAEGEAGRDLAGARAYVGRLRKHKAAGEAWLAYALSPGPHSISEEAYPPHVPDGIKKTLARFGVWPEGLPWEWNDAGRYIGPAYRPRNRKAKGTASAGQLDALRKGRLGLEAAFFLPDMNRRRQDPDEKNLLVQHNLTAENLIHADELGGLAAPSLAVSKVDHPLEGFGEITLLGAPSMADPERGTPVFGSDVYSPRHPRASFKVVPKALKKLREFLSPFAKTTGNYVGNLENELESGPADVASKRSVKPALELAWLTEKGLAPEIPMKKPEARYPGVTDAPAVRKFFEDHFAEHQSIHIRDELVGTLSGLVKAAIEALPPDDDTNVMREVAVDWFDENGQLGIGTVDAIARDARAYMEAAKGDKVDTYALEDRLKEAVDQAGRGEFEKWADATLSAAVGERFIKKVSDSGNVRRLPYTLDNVLKEMTRTIRQGEGTTMGLGTVRAAGTKKFRTLEQIKKARNTVVSKADFEVEKEKSNKRFFELSEEVSRYHQNPGGFRILDGLAEAIAASYKRGHYLSAELRLSGFEGVPSELQERIARFRDSLLKMPTEYFEAKPQRVVGLQEFDTAVVPEGTRPEALEVLKKHGLEVITYAKGDEKARQAAVARAAEARELLFQQQDLGDVTRAAFTSLREAIAKHGKESPEAVAARAAWRKAAEDEAVAINARGNKLFAKSGPTTRGWAEVHREGAQKLFKLFFTKDKNVSTLVHESAHVFLELFAEVAQRSDAPPQLKADFAAAMKWMGVAAPAEGQQWTFPETAHEKWARGFEQYLREGKAPAGGLVGAFTRFGLWLVDIYKSAAELNVELNDEVRGVFDRLLAADEEVQRHRSRTKPLFKSPEDAARAGLSPEDYQRWLQVTEDENATTMAMLAAAAVKDQKRETEAWWKEAEAAKREEAELEFEQLPARQAQQYLKALDRPLDRTTVENAVGKKSGRKFHLAADGGIEIEAIDDIGERYGFPTGADMLAAVAVLPEKDLWARKRAAHKMQEEHPSVFLDRQALRLKVEELSHRDEVRERLVQEWAALRKLGPRGQPTRPPVEAIEMAALQILGNKNASKLRLTELRQAERKAAEATATAVAKGEYEQAAVLKQKHLLNFFLYNEARKAIDDREKLLDLVVQLKKPASNERIGKASAVYQSGINWLLEALGWKELQPGEEPAAGSLSEVMLELESDGFGVAFEPKVVERALARRGLGGWKNLSVNQLAEVHKALKNIQRAAQNRNAILKGEAEVSKELAVEELLNDAADVPPLPPGPTSEASTGPWDRARAQANAFAGSLFKPEVVLERLGPSWTRYLFDPLNKAKQNEADIVKRLMAPVIDAFDKMPKEIRRGLNRKVDGKKLFPTWHTEGERQMRPPSRRVELLMMALHAGNASNMERLLGGFGIDGTQLRAALDLLTKEELDWVQSVWDLLDSVWPEIQALEQRSTGVAPAPLKRVPLVTRHGTYQGGYFPAVYDPAYSSAGERQHADVVAEFMDFEYAGFGTSHSFTKSRVEGFVGALSLEPRHLQTHLLAVAHDLAFREAIRSSGRVLLDGRVQQVLKDRLGVESARQLREWMKDVGGARGLDGMRLVGAWARAAQWMKGNTVVAVMGYSIPTALGDLTNPLVAVIGTDLKAKHLAGAWAELASPRGLEAYRAAHAKSGELRFRRDEIRRDLTRQLKNLSSHPVVRAFRGIDRYAFSIFEATDALTSTPVWMGAYNQAVAEGKSEEAAVHFADGIVRRAFPSHHVVDLAPVLRDKGVVGALLYFHGYFNQVFNLEARLWQEARGKGALAHTRAAGRMLGVLMVSMVLSELFSGRGPEAGDGDEPWEKWRNWYFRKMLGGAMSLVPFGSGVGQALEAGLLDKAVRPTARNIDAFSAVLAIGHAAMALADNEDSEKTQKKVEAVVRALGPVHGLPVVQPIRTLGYLWQLLNGLHPDDNPADIGSGLIWGDRGEGQPTTPLNLFGAGPNRAAQ